MCLIVGIFFPIAWIIGSFVPCCKGGLKNLVGTERALWIANIVAAVISFVFAVVYVAISVANDDGTSSGYRVEVIG